MESIEAMTYGHPYWNETAAFAEACPWKAGKLLARMMRENAFAENERVIVALADGAVAGFCTFSMKDELPPEYGFTPFTGFVYVGEKYRGRRLSARMIDASCAVAKAQGYTVMHVMSGETGLYEKYGFEKIGEYGTIRGTTDQLFVRSL